MPEMPQIRIIADHGLVTANLGIGWRGSFTADTARRVEA